MCSDCVAGSSTRSGGYCMLHGWHGMMACPSCSTAAPIKTYEIHYWPPVPIPSVELAETSVELATAAQVARLHDRIADLERLVGDLVDALRVDASGT